MLGEVPLRESFWVGPGYARTSYRLSLRSSQCDYGSAHALILVFRARC